MTKIPRYARGEREWPYEVRLLSDVPDAKRFPSEGCAIAVAMQRAANVGGTVSVFEYGDCIAQAVQDPETNTVTLRKPRR